jgi:oxygen-dependent protoporphyrinogen oxidase
MSGIPADSHGKVGAKPGDKRGTTMFQTLRGGLASLIEAVAKSMPGVHIMQGVSVHTVTSLPQGGYRLPLSNGAALDVEQVVVTAPAFAAATLLEQLDKDAAAILAGIPYVSVATIAFCYPRSALKTHLPGTGFVVPSAEGITLTACTYVSSKWPHASREDQVLLRSYLGQAGREVRGWSEARLIETARRELGSLIDLEGEPTVTRLYHWENAMPQYRVGHLELMQRLGELIQRHNGLYLAGSAYKGLGLPDCIKQGEQAAEKVAAALVGQPIAPVSR